MSRVLYLHLVLRCFQVVFIFVNTYQPKRETVPIERGKVKTPRGIFPFGVLKVGNVLLNAFTEASTEACT